MSERCFHPGDHLSFHVQDGPGRRLSVGRAVSTEAKLGELAAADSGQHRRHLVRAEVSRGHALLRCGGRIAASSAYETALAVS